MSDGPDPDAWLVTFGDMVFLLLTFFVLMLSMSSMDNKRLKEAFEHFGGQPGIFVGGDSTIIGPEVEDSEEGSKEAVRKGMEIATLIEGAMKTSSEESVAQSAMMLDAKGEVRIKGVPFGKAIVFSGAFAFGRNSAEIRVRALPVLDSIARVLRGGTRQISIQGHTDDRESPLDPRYRDLWDLSVGRAVNVLKYLIQKGKINPGRLSIVGYGESRPERPNTSEENRLKNRRVEIVITEEQLS
jgi:chemotaxis protein MotB